MNKNNKIEQQLGMAYAWIPAGEFVMGSPENENGRMKNEMQHKVILSKDFYMQTTHVTVAQWRQFVERTGYVTQAEVEDGAFATTLNKDGAIHEHVYWDAPDYKKEDDFPVSCVSWVDVQVFIRWLNQQGGANYRLPTEAEWEYSCRAGTTTPYSFGEVITTDLANHLDRSVADYEENYRLAPLNPDDELDLRPCSVARFKPNPWGLYDMHGNMWEWCQDRAKVYQEKLYIWVDCCIDGIIDPVSVHGSKRIARGGTWNYYPTFCRSSHRIAYDKNERYNYLGFRLLREA